MGYRRATDRGSDPGSGHRGFATGGAFEMKPHTPSLAELQHIFSRNLLRDADHDANDDIAAVVLGDGLAPQARLNIYRNTALSVLTNALRLSFPAVQRLVGPEFFDGAARLFCGAAPPDSAWLDEYGARFPGFLARMPHAASLPYLGDVARLEWQVNLVLHAPDDPILELARLAGLDDVVLGELRLRPHPAARLLCCDFPADAIWRAVLGHDDTALRAIRLEDGPVHLLVQCTAEGVETLRLSVAEWRITTALFAGEAMSAALAAAPEADGHALIATCLARGCFAEASQSANGCLFDGGSPT
ncbi:DNA-binding domain-containing protein [Burkholderia sp. Bp9140]|uniref:HvfC/BufC N-terminal domain-containing protein n=1 Tax=Burkholderia sp. Bp9140 TaxID=2184572 RepID=UPI0028935F17|nr:DNA-binding domain-containing protein [Burkholderia sp. Bp9140]